MAGPFEVQITGGQRRTFRGDDITTTVTWNADLVKPQINKVLEANIMRAAVFAQNSAKRLMAQPGTGRLYKKKGGRIHHASAPGDPPTIDTGTYNRSIQIDDTDLDRQLVRVGTNLGSDDDSTVDFPYPVALEFGTRTIAKRPMWRPLLFIVRRFIEQFILPRMRREMERGFRR